MLQKKLKEIKQEVDSFLKELFDKKKKKIGAVHPEVEKLIVAIEDVTLRGGDRFRPFMVWLGVQCASVQNEKRIDKELLKLVCSVELLHSFALIHDDIIDRAETRRGGPTIKPDEKAILAGDMCFVFADELLNGVSVSVKEIFDELREEVIAGEWLDVKFARESWEDFDMKHPINLIHEYKTARYSFEKPLKLGVTFAGGALSDNLQQFAIKAGVAFQYADDYLDLFGDKRLGKKIGGDIKEGNITIFHESLIDLKDKFDFKKYCRIWHHPNLTAQDILWVQDLVKKTGVKKQVEEKMKKLIKEAKNCLEKANVDPEVKKTLSEFADFLIEREY